MSAADREKLRNEVFDLVDRHRVLRSRLLVCVFFLASTVCGFVVYRLVRAVLWPSASSSSSSWFFVSPWFQFSLLLLLVALAMLWAGQTYLASKIRERAERLRKIDR